MNHLLSFLSTLAVGLFLSVTGAWAQETPTVVPKDDAEFAPGGDVRAGQEQLNALRADLQEVLPQRFAVPETAFEIFPEAVRQDIQSYITQVIQLLATDNDEGLRSFLDENRSKIATIFDQLGIEESADGLLAGGGLSEDSAETDGAPVASNGGNPTSAISFPNEYQNYDAYLDSLSDQLTSEERTYLKESNRIASTFRTALDSAAGNQERLQAAMEKYRQELQAINDQYAEHFRERYLESLESAGADGGRPDIDR